VIFETMLAIGGRVVQLEEHFARLARSARELGLPAPDDGEFRDALVLPSDECAVRCVYDGAFAVTSGPIPATTLRRRNGAHAITLDRSIVRESPQHKLTSYAEWLRTQIIDGDEGLFVDSEGRVLEGMVTNVFAVDGDTLTTSADGVLPGVVRGWVIDNARVIFRRPSIAELRAGSFLTSSLTLLAPIVSIDGVACARPGPVFEELRRRYHSVAFSPPHRGEGAAGG
jgi:branched-chain amino acid aminotransferase